MTSPKLPDSRPLASPRIACYGTAFLSDTAVDLALERGIRPDVPQFSSPRLDASFLINCGRLHAACLLAGGLATIETAPNAYVKRVRSTDFRSPKTTVFYQCSTELRGLLAALTPERTAEMATEWYGMYGPQKSEPPKSSGRTHIRLTILENLAVLAKQARDNQVTLMLRVDYRKQR